MIADATSLERPRPLRVALVVPSLEVGGLQQATTQICSHVDPREVAIRVIALRPPVDGSTIMLERLEASGTPVDTLGTRARADRSPREFVRAATQLRRLVRRHDLDVLDTAIFEVDMVARAALLGSRCEHVVHLINTTYDASVGLDQRSRTPWRPRAAQALDRHSGRLTARYVAITRAVAESATHELAVPARKLHIVPRGVERDTDIAEDSGPPVPEQPLASPVRLVNVGRYSPQKNQDALIRAVGLLRDRGTDVELTILGQGPLEDELKELRASLGLDRAVHMPAPVADVRRVLHEHDIFCLPSAWEGLSNALLEAMACGLPVVLNDIPVFREVCGSLATFVDAASPASLAEGISQLANATPQERSRRGARLRERSRERFDPRGQARALTDIWADVARSPRPRTTGVARA